MPDDTQRRLILGNGEFYVNAVTKKYTGRAQELPRSYDEARDRVKAGVGKAISNFESLAASKKIQDEAVFCMRLHPDATAKSYNPVKIFSEVPELKNVGSRYYKVETTKVAETKRIQSLKEKETDETSGRLIFVQGTPIGFQKLIKILDNRAAKLTEDFRNEIQRIEFFDTLSAEEQISGFDEDWKHGRAELVFHPSSREPEEIEEFFEEFFQSTGLDPGSVTKREYPNGPTFLSCRLNRKILKKIFGTVPLRAAHPFEFKGLPDLRSSKGIVAPKPPSTTTKSKIIIGMFDGGIDSTVELLRGHVEEDLTLEIDTPASQDGVSHGTAVAGALLHGALNPYEPTDRLPPPPVVSIRVLPTSNPDDLDLYESIDVIERAVPARSDIKIFNLSFGPRGPIEDDPISRFTWVLDSLAYTHKVTFFVAVGNDGTAAPYNRIQAPSDLVHGVGVGAYTEDKSGFVHAPYSCRGPGRECGKIKPDIAAFGGCRHKPIHLVSTNSGEVILNSGTSFAAPIAARLGGLATETFDRSSALIGRTLLIHTATHPNGDPDHLLGHGCVHNSIDDVLYCDEKSVTVVFQRGILPTDTIQLPIPWPDQEKISGKVEITWTVASLPPVDPLHPGDYTSSCLVDTFYPHSLKHEYSPPKDKVAKKVKLHSVDDLAQIQKLLKAGWKKSLFPVTDSGNTYKTEVEQRAIDCKWEPLVRRRLSKMVTSIHEPFMTISAFGRNGASQRFDYVAIVTLKVKSFSGDLYTEIRKKYPRLQPIRVRTEAELRVQI